MVILEQTSASLHADDYDDVVTKKSADLRKATFKANQKALLEAYRARDPMGRVVEGEMEAPSAERLVEELQGRALTPVRIAPLRLSRAEETAERLDHFWFVVQEIDDSIRGRHEASEAVAAGSSR